MTSSFSSSPRSFAITYAKKYSLRPRLHSDCACQLSTTSFFVNGRRLTLDLLHSAAVAYRHDELAPEDVRALSAWAKALFDSNSEGIEDTILRSTKPKQLLRIAASLFSNAIGLCMERKMDKELLNNGVSYFLGPLLSWTLTGVIKALLSEIQHRRWSEFNIITIVPLIEEICPQAGSLTYPLGRSTNPTAITFLSPTRPPAFIIRHSENNPTTKTRTTHGPGRLRFNSSRCHQSLGAPRRR